MKIFQSVISVLVWLYRRTGGKIGGLHRLTALSFSKITMLNQNGLNTIRQQ